MRAIDADALQKEYMHEHDGKRLMLIDVAPTIEPRCETCEAFNKTRLLIPQPERKKGKWLPDNNNYYEERFICSVCGKSYKVDTCMGKPIWDFCPNCGARLDGKDGDNHD